MSYKPLPKPVTERTLQRKYTQLAEVTHGRIDVSTDSGKRLSALLHRYISSFSNLYGQIPLWTAWKLFCEVEPELVQQKKILKKDFFSFSDILRAESLPYYVLNLEELFSEEKDAKLDNRTIVNKKLVGHGYYRFEDFYTLLDSQDDKPFIMLNREDYLSWAEPDRFRTSPYARDMLRFFETLCVSKNSKSCDSNGHSIKGKKLNSFIFWSKDERSFYHCVSRSWEKEAIALENNIIESEKLMRKIERHIHLGDDRVSTSDFLHWLTNDLDEVGVQLTEKKFENLIKLYMNLNNKSRLWCNCGWTPEELSRVSISNVPPSISFGPGLQAAFASGGINQSELEHVLRGKGLTILK